MYFTVPLLLLVVVVYWHNEMSLLKKQESTDHNQIFTKLFSPSHNIKIYDSRRPQMTSQMSYTYTGASQ